MGQDSSWASTTLKTRFSQFQQDPLEHFAVRLRQLRAEQLRQLLANPATVTLEIFNQEVWPIGSVMVNGQTRGDLLDMETGIGVAQLPELTIALDQGKIEIHGNAMWGSGSHIYGAQLKASNEEKVQYIRQAVAILNDVALSPLQKAQRIDGLPGFGFNSSTALVMVFHPAAFAIFNEPSQSAMRTLGFSFENLEKFEERAQALKELLGAKDFLELDLFLYLVYKGRIHLPPKRQVWWVNQGATFAIESAGGYLWAPKHGKNNVVFQHWSDMTKLQPEDIVLHYANGVLRAVSRVLEAAKDEPRPGELPTETWETAGYLARVQYYPLEQPIPLQSIPLEWRTETNGPFMKDGGVKQGYLFPLTNEFADKLKEEWRELQKLIDQQPLPKSRTRPIEFAELFQRILDQGLDFSYEMIANYLLALQTKRFVILTGLSGTGKTQLAMAVARCFDRSSLILGSTESMLPPKSDEGNGQPKYSRLVAVRPDWRDNRGLLGYFNPLLERYSVTPILHLLLCAQEEFEAALRERREAISFFIILDEMNLARVEYYFSDFLSSLESGEPLDLQEHPSTGMDETGGTMMVPAHLKIHHNVFFTGTVNIDETTYMFSPKVLDRAFTLELNEVNLTTFGQRELRGDLEITPLYLHHFPGRLNYDHKPNTADWERFGQLLNGELRDVVVELNVLLSNDRQNFGYRVASEIACFVNLAAEQTEGTDTALWTALDLAILQKVLPKFNGTQQELEEVLGNVFVFAIAGKRVNEEEKKRFLPEVWRMDSGHLILNGLNYAEEYSQPRLPRTATKLWTMWNRLLKQGFTSYIS